MQSKPKNKCADAGVSGQINWTFTEAFNIILHEQAKLVQQYCGLDDRFQQLVLAIWVSFLEVTEVGFQDNVKSCKMPKLQMITRARDLAVIVDKKDSITYPGRKPKIFTNSAFRIGSKVMHRVVSRDQAKKEGGQVSDRAEKVKWKDVNFVDMSDEADDDDEYEEKRPKCRHRKTKSEYQRIYNIALKKFEPGEGEEDTDEEAIERKIHDEEEKLKELTDPDEQAIGERFIQDMKRRLRMSSITKKLEEMNDDDSLCNFSNKRKRSYCRSLAASMTSCKTLGIIYLALRILNLNVFSFDLVRWINCGHIPFFNTFQLLPNDWHFIINDFHSLNSLYSPQPNAINQHSTNIANLIGVKELKVPSMRKLIFRFVDDLNLPHLLSDLIVNLFESRFCEEKKVRELVKKSIQDGGSIPEYESIALAMIILTLKKLFGVNGIFEKDVSRKLLKEGSSSQHLFIWSEWEAHTRIKLESIAKHFFPAFDQNIEDLENLDLMYDYYKKVVHIENKPEIASKKKKLDKGAFLSLPNIFKNILKSDLDVKSGGGDAVDEEEEVEEDEAAKLLEPDLYPLKSLTKFILKKYDPRNYELLSKDFRPKSISYLFEEPEKLPDDNRLINSRIFCLDRIVDWSDSFKFLVKLSCFVLNKREHSFLDKLYYVENSVFRHYNLKRSDTHKKQHV